MFFWWQANYTQSFSSFHCQKLPSSNILKPVHRTPSRPPWRFLCLYLGQRTVPEVHYLKVIIHFVTLCTNLHHDLLEARGVLAIFIYGGVRMKGQIQTQKYGFSVNFAPQNIVILHILYPKHGSQFYFRHKFDSKELFLRYYIIELRENGNCRKLLPPKSVKFMFANFRPKNMAFK